MKYKFKLKHLVLAVLVVKAVLYGGAKPAGRQRGKGLLQPFVSQKMGQSHQIFRN